MANFYADNDELRYYVERFVPWERLVELTELGYRSEGSFESAEEAVALYQDLLNLVGECVAEEIAPHVAEIDRQGVALEDGEVVFPERLKSLFRTIDGLELHGMCLPRELGGQNLPLLMYFLVTELFARSDASVSAHFGFHGGIAMAMLMLSLDEGSTEVDPSGARITKTRFADAIEEIRQGKAWGCMDITEPDAGSDMAALRTRAELDDDGQWRLHGQKIFITSGHGKYHFVIARSEDQATDANDPLAGLKGLSMFLVQTYEELEDGSRKRLACIERVEEKLGHHASATCVVSFDGTPAELVGSRGEGFRHMLTLMNTARLGVAFESMGLCEAAFRLAKAYAAERPSMGKSIDQHELIADYLDEMQSDLEGIRALTMHGTLNEEMGQRIGMMLDFELVSEPEERERLQQERAILRERARRATPLAKYLATEKAVEMARRCVQIHGGVGYTTEYGAEKLLRDAVAMPIYEGTSQIQALMAMKDTLTGVIRNPQEFVRRAAKARWRALSGRDALERRLGKLQTLCLRAQQHLLTRTAVNKYRGLHGAPLSEWPKRFLQNWDPKKDFTYALLHAERLTQILCDELICEELYEQSLRHPERRHVLARYLERAEPRVRYLFDCITTTGDRVLSLLDGDEEAAERDWSGEEPGSTASPVPASRL